MLVRFLRRWNKGNVKRVVVDSRDGFVPVTVLENLFGSFELLKFEPAELMIGANNPEHFKRGLLDVGSLVRTLHNYDNNDDLEFVLLPEFDFASNKFPTTAPQRFVGDALNNLWMLSCGGVIKENFGSFVKDGVKQLATTNNEIEGTEFIQMIDTSDHSSQWGFLLVANAKVGVIHVIFTPYPHNGLHRYAKTEQQGTRNQHHWRRLPGVKDAVESFPFGAVIGYLKANTNVGTVVVEGELVGGTVALRVAERLREILRATNMMRTVQVLSVVVNPVGLPSAKVTRLLTSSTDTRESTHSNSVREISASSMISTDVSDHPTQCCDPGNPVVQCDKETEHDIDPCSTTSTTRSPASPSERILCLKGEDGLRTTRHIWTGGEHDIVFQTQKSEAQPLFHISSLLSSALSEQWHYLEWLSALRKLDELIMDYYCGRCRQNPFSPTEQALAFINSTLPCGRIIFVSQKSKAYRGRQIKTPFGFVSFSFLNVDTITVNGDELRNQRPVNVYIENIEDHKEVTSRFSLSPNSLKVSSESLRTQLMSLLVSGSEDQSQPQQTNKGGGMVQTNNSANDPEKTGLTSQPLKYVPLLSLLKPSIEVYQPMILEDRGNSLDILLRLKGKNFYSVIQPQCSHPPQTADTSLNVGNLLHLMEENQGNSDNESKEIFFHPIRLPAELACLQISGVALLSESEILEVVSVKWICAKRAKSFISSQKQTILKLIETKAQLSTYFGLYPLFHPRSEERDKDTDFLIEQPSSPLCPPPSKIRKMMTAKIRAKARLLKETQLNTRITAHHEQYAVNEYTLIPPPSLTDPYQPDVVEMMRAFKVACAKGPSGLAGICSNSYFTLLMLLNKRHLLFPSHLDDTSTLMLPNSNHIGEHELTGWESVDDCLASFVFLFIEVASAPWPFKSQEYSPTSQTINFMKEINISHVINQTHQADCSLQWWQTIETSANNRKNTQSIAHSPMNTVDLHYTVMDALNHVVYQGGQAKRYEDAISRLMGMFGWSQETVEKLSIQQPSATWTRQIESPLILHRRFALPSILVQSMALSADCLKISSDQVRRIFVPSAQLENKGESGRVAHFLNDLVLHLTASELLHTGVTGTPAEDRPGGLLVGFVGTHNAGKSSWITELLSSVGDHHPEVSTIRRTERIGWYTNGSELDGELRGHSAYVSLLDFPGSSDERNATSSLFTSAGAICDVIVVIFRCDHVADRERKILATALRMGVPLIIILNACDIVPVIPNVPKKLIFKEVVRCARSKRDMRMESLARKASRDLRSKIFDLFDREDEERRLLAEVPIVCSYRDDVYGRERVRKLMFDICVRKVGSSFQSHNECLALSLISRRQFHILQQLVLTPLCSEVSGEAKDMKDVLRRSGIDRVVPAAAREFYKPRNGSTTGTSQPYYKTLADISSDREEEAEAQKREKEALSRALSNTVLLDGHLVKYFSKGFDVVEYMKESDGWDSTECGTKPFEWILHLKWLGDVAVVGQLMMCCGFMVGVDWYHNIFALAIAPNILSNCAPLPWVGRAVSTRSPMVEEFGADTSSLFECAEGLDVTLGDAKEATDLDSFVEVVLGLSWTHESYKHDGVRRLRSIVEGFGPDKLGREIEKRLGQVATGDVAAGELEERRGGGEEDDEEGLARLLQCYGRLILLHTLFPAYLGLLHPQPPRPVLKSVLGERLWIDDCGGCPRALRAILERAVSSWHSGEGDRAVFDGAVGEIKSIFEGLGLREIKKGFCDAAGGAGVMPGLVHVPVLDVDETTIEPFPPPDTTESLVVIRWALVELAAVASSQPLRFRECLRTASLTISVDSLMPRGSTPVIGSGWHIRVPLVESREEMRKALGHMLDLAAWGKRAGGIST